MPETIARTVREAMHEGCEYIGQNRSVFEAAKRMEQLDIGAMPICAEGDRLKGMITEADIARHLPREKTGEMVSTIVAAAPQHF